MKVELPRYAQIEPVGQCNLRCQMCSIQFRQDGPPYGPPAFMAYDVFTRLVDEFRGLRQFHLQGLGEPMMHPRFFDMVAYAAGKGVTVSTNTNATLLTERRAAACIASGLDCIHVSLDAADAPTYERIRVRAHFDRVVANVERFLAIRAQTGGERPRLRLVMVVMRQNLRHLPELVRRAHQWSAEGLFAQHLCHDFGEATLPAQYHPMREFVREQTLLGEDPEVVEQSFDEARTLARALGVDLRLPRAQPRPYPPGTSGRQRCDWPWSGAYVSYQGVAMPCCMVSTPDRANLGDMAASGVANVWREADYADFRARLDSADPPDICRSWVVERLHAALTEEGCGFFGAFPAGLSHRDDVRPEQQIVEWWDGPVRPEAVEPDSPAWERRQLHRAANGWHAGQRLRPGETRLYKVAWVASCVLYNRRNVEAVGGFSFWSRLPRWHSGEEALVQNLLMRRWGGCAILPSGTTYAQVPTTVLNARGTVDGHALALLPEMVARYCPSAGA
ncbi:MAG TPA: radical SAM/SPASM domain-containing protein [Ktedonobacterales bacterium]|nr:radical SAM/SPASM domain-containing protein [Ktedonobacterales bacterium]